MSWGYEKTGTPAALARDVTAYFDNVASMYKGQAEADDVLACKERILKLIAACDLTLDPSTGLAVNGVRVSARGSGSRTGTGVAAASFAVEVNRVCLALDDPPPAPAA